MTEIWAIATVLSAAVLGALGQLNFKLGSDKLTFKIFDIIKNKFLIIGVILYGISTVMFIVSLKGGELSVLYPLIATSYVWATILAKKVLKEDINMYKTTGILLIIIGVAVIFIN